MAARPPRRRAARAAAGLAALLAAALAAAAVPPAGQPAAAAQPAAPCLRNCNAARNHDGATELRAAYHRYQARPGSGAARAGQAGPALEWAYVPACQLNGPPGSGLEALCPAATRSCPEEGAVRFREYSRPAGRDGVPWRLRRVVCLTGGAFEAAAPPPFLVAIERLKRLEYPGPQIRVAPGKGLAHLESTFWTAARERLAGSVRAGPNLVEVEATVARYEWSFGDGHELVTTFPGRPWPRPGSIRHAYQDGGWYEVRLTAVWEGVFRVNGGPPRPIPGVEITRTSHRRYPVREIRTVLLG